MNHVMMRPFSVLRAAVLVAALVMSGSAVAAATPAPAPTQSFTGGSVGSLQIEPFGGTQFAYAGGYRSNGQLGAGQMSFSFGFTGSPGQAMFVRSDGMTMTGAAVFVDACGPIPVTAYCVSADVSGSADIVKAHLVLAVALTGPNVGALWMSGTLTLKRRLGYMMVTTNGDAFSFGGANLQPANPGSPEPQPRPTEVPLHIPGVVSVALTRSGGGYWVVNNAGQVYAYGDAPYLGGADMSAFLSGQRVTTISAAPTGKGYWLFTSDGRALRFGDARLFGDLHSTALNGGIVGSIATPTGRGYYMVGSDGGVFAFGDAKFRGSMGGVRLNKPVVGLVPTSDNSGYWLVASDGGVFSFDAPFHGSMGAVALNQPVVAMVPYGGAYLMVASDGGVFNFSAAPFFGSAADSPITAPIVNAAVTG